MFLRLQISFLACVLTVSAAPRNEVDVWTLQAARVTIIRDNWGIAHIYGRTDADAVFGMMYAQAEDDFPRIETNYLNALGRLSEAEGESKIFADLRMRLFIDPAVLKSEYARSPQWLKILMNAFANGLNYFLYRHPEVKPRVIQRFEPWMALSFTEGSIGGDIERIDLERLQSFYRSDKHEQVAHKQGVADGEPAGSNGIAIAPSNTKGGHSLLLINPHTSFFFRSELQMVSNEGLNAYGAATWGQFFIYQGFNDRVGWMHTSSGVDAVDEYLETVTGHNGDYRYRYAGGERALQSSRIAIPYKTKSGMQSRAFTIYRSHHGPIIGQVNGKWISVRLMQEHVKALMQSYLRTKATDYQSYRQTMELHANSSNNTIYADTSGNIAYFHGNFIPRRNPSFDWTKAVDGTSRETEWRGLLSVDETPKLLNPKSGWLYNSNNWPWSAAGSSSPKPEDFPPYVEAGTESARGLHAVRVLKNKKDFTLDSLIAAAYDSYLTWFDRPIPALLKAWDELPVADKRKSELKEQIALFRSWDRRWSVNSIATSLAVFWAEAVRSNAGTNAKALKLSPEAYAADKMTPDDLLRTLSDATNRLIHDFGSWRKPWGEINRYQRLTEDILPVFNDSKPSIPVGFTSGNWGSLASFGARAYQGTKKWYGTSGNSFVAAVEFGERVRAKAVTAGGESGHLNSPHFNDQAVRYSQGELRDVYFYRSDLNGHIERRYHPGE